MLLIRPLLLFASCLVIGTPAALAAVPKPSGYVTDDAGLLTPQQIASLNQSLSDYEQRTSNQLVVLTVKSLDGQDIESYSIAVTEAWKPGRKGRDNGAILLVAPNERKVRIEVGYGLEGVLTDAKSAEIIRTILAPHFRAGDYYGGIVAAVAAMEAAIGGEFTAEREKPAPAVSFYPVLLLLLVVAGLIGQIHWTAGAATGGVLAGWSQLGGLGLIPAVMAGLLLGAAAPFFMKLLLGAYGWPVGGKSWNSRSGLGGFGGFGGGGFWGGGFGGGGFGGGGFGGGGGFSGGGGGFGGGGASGSW